jgi:hypothetical protein
MKNQKTVSFYRLYHSYTGGHQKIRDYLSHLLSTSQYRACFYLDSQSSIHNRLFEEIDGVEYQLKYQPNKADFVFLAGMDWNAYLSRYDPNRPVINLIQHVRHSDKNHPLFKFLKYRAIRICVSDTVRRAIEPYANGPCFTIKMGHAIPDLRQDKVYDLYILGTKQPKMASDVASWASSNGLRVQIHDTPQEKDIIHLSMARSIVSLVLPNKTEGFYLPGIEAMSLANWAVVPDCIASREYSLNNVNVSSCDLSVPECIRAVEKAFREVCRWNFRYKKWKGYRLANSYKLSSERKAFLSFMSNIEKYWPKT